MIYKIGYFEDTHEGERVFQTLKTIKCLHDAEAEAEVDCLYHQTPKNWEGELRSGLYIKRGKTIWFKRFSCHAGKR